LIVQDGVIPAGLIIDYSTAGMKELDALAAHIDSLRRFVTTTVSVILVLAYPHVQESGC